MHRRPALAALLLFLAGTAFAAETIEGFAPESARSLARGGYHAASGGDLEALFSNPAGLATAPRQIEFAKLGFRLSGPVFDIANAMQSGDDLMTSVTDVLAKHDYRINAGLDLAGPLYFAYSGEGLAFGLFSRTKAGLNASSISTVGLSVREDLLLAGAYAFRLDLGGGHALDLGFGAKGFVRGEMAITESLVSIQDILGDLGSLYSDTPFFLTTGVGVDLGLRWSWESLAAGLVCRDAFSPAVLTEYASASGFFSDPSAAKVESGYALVDPDLAVGFSWHPALGRLARYVDDFILFLDYADILGLFEPIPRNAVLNLRLGAEARVLDILSLRLGMNEALLAAGVGLDLSVVQVEMAVFGEELGLDPGDRPSYNLLLGFDFLY
ncbi:MAG TPA: hypothetical protein PLB91_14055 [Spirochaetales bacterium]|nr:hypothetical protein [Spirochaetales bacterium]HRY53890.1 hypothetical protein [Spirochaetia bacterium]